MKICHLTAIFSFGCRLIFAGVCEQTNNTICMNGGTCLSIGINNYECQCLNGFSGKNCSWNEDDCVDNLCSIGSTCIDGIAKYTCACPPGKIGLFCHLDDPCLQKPCGNGADCIVDTASGEYLCDCMKGTTGPNCANDVNECEKSEKLCFNGGICVNTYGSWYCDCPPGYSDPYCMTYDNKCEPNPCLNGASCLDYGNRFECICQNGFYGSKCGKVCPANFENRACKQHRISSDNNHLEELFEKQICMLQNCTSKAGNDICDSECNYPACQYDGFDCSAHIEPFEYCSNANFCARVFQDNKCDSICNNPDCLFDGFDCNKETEKCMYENYCSLHFNDGYCDPECNSRKCYHDGNDCVQQNSYVKLEGNLILIILMPSEEFARRVPILQFILSQGMQARVTTAVDENGTKRLYEWKAKKRGDYIYGTKAYFNIEIEHCQKGPDCEPKIMDVEQAANFVGAMNSKQILRRIGASIYASEAELPHRIKKSEKWLLYALSGIIVQFIVIALLLTLHKNFKRRIAKRRIFKKVRVASTWFPPTLDSYFSLKLLNDNHKNGDTMQGNDTINKEIDKKSDQMMIKQDQDHYSTEIRVLLDNDNESERRWTILHEQALDSYPIEIPVDQSLVDIKSSAGRTALMLTALNQNKTEKISCMDVENLLRAGSAIDEQDDCGETALIMAIKAGRAEVVKCLLQYGADPTIPDDHKRTALHHAASINASDIVRIILETNEVEVDSVDETDCSPLMIVAKLGYRDPETIALLIDAGADINCTGNHVNGEMYQGRTALHYAVMQSNQELARYLVERGANLNIQDQMGQTPLFLAASQGHVEMVHMLVQAGARRYIPDNMDQTPEQIASYKEYKEVVDYFATLRKQQHDVLPNEKRKSKSNKNVKKPRIIELTEQQEQMTGMQPNLTFSGTPENSNSSSSSGFFDRSKEHFNLDSQLPYEVTSQALNSHIIGQTLSNCHNSQSHSFVNDENRLPAIPPVGIEHYV